MSIGDAAFGQDMRAALDDDDLLCSQEGDEEYEDELLEDGLAAAPAKVGAPVLLPTPEATQDPDGFMFGASNNSEEDDHKEEQKREELISMHTTLTSMTRKISNLYEEVREAVFSDNCNFFAMRSGSDAYCCPRRTPS